jgi:uncharacterized protein
MMDPIDRCLELLNAGDDEALLALVEADSLVAEGRDAAGISLVMHALYRGRRELAETVARRKRTLDIFEASALGQNERLKKILRHDSVLNGYSSDGFTALHFACFFGQPEAARLLIEKGAKVDAVANNPTRVMPLHSAASSRNMAAARLLLEHGAPVNARQQAGWIPIHAAAQNGDREMVELLLAHSADTEITNDAGKTAAMIAREKGHADIAVLLSKQPSGA